jgi:hypothetical protein
MQLMWQAEISRKKVRPQLSSLTREVASRIRIGEEELELPTLESALVRLNL